MAAKAYILIRTAPGLTGSIRRALQASALVESVEMITGPYDLIVSMEAASTEELLATVMKNIRPAAGIRDTMTCLVVPDEEQE
jgi:DNA-binding Lrp family transcriptional regulator